jgi:hypothetical protein
MQAISSPRDVKNPSAPAPSDSHSSSTNGVEMVDYGLEINVQGVRDSLRMTLEFASEDVADQRSEKIDLSSAKPSKESGFNPPAAGSKFEIEISLPATLQPGAMILNLRSCKRKHPSFLALSVHVSLTESQSSNVVPPRYTLDLKR